MYIPTIEEIERKCKKVIESCRCKPENEEYGESLDFFMKNNFFAEECNNLDLTLAALILPRLIYYEQTTTGYPGEFYRQDENGKCINEKESLEKWHEILKKMIYAFYLILESFDSIETDTKENIAAKKEGLKLFAKYYESLWD